MLDWIDKQICGDWTYKSRFIWIDPVDKSFHWSKTDDRSVPHKRLRLEKRVARVYRNVSAITSESLYSITVEFENMELLKLRVCCVVLYVLFYY